jgi:hypothetical protein
MAVTTLGNEIVKADVNVLLVSITRRRHNYWISLIGWSRFAELIGYRPRKMSFTSIGANLPRSEKDAFCDSIPILSYFWVSR